MATQTGPELTQNKLFIFNIDKLSFHKIMKTKIAIIGAGNIGKSMAEGLLASEGFLPGNLHLTRNKLSYLDDLKMNGAVVGSDNLKAVSDSEIIVLAVKPYRVETVIEQIRTVLNPDKHIIVSLATGISMTELSEFLKMKIPVFRITPNIAISVGESMSCICSKDADKNQINQVQQIFNLLGKTEIISEELVDAAIVLGACGIAYVMRFIRAMMQGGIEIGFDAETAGAIATQTVKGASELLAIKGLHPEREIDKVTTPKGCTIAGLNEMEHQGFSSSLIKGILTSYKKIEEI